MKLTSNVRVGFLVFIIALFLTACGGGDSDKVSDSTAPTATAILPAVNATNVDVDTVVMVVFDEAIDPASLDTNSFQLMDGAAVVAATVVHDQVNDLLTLMPGAALADNTHYTAVVDAGLTDVAGNSLGSSYSWSFTTAPGPVTDTTAPVATALVPMGGETDIDVATTVIVAFDEAIDPASLDTNSFRLMDGATVVTATVAHDQTNDLLVLTPVAALADNTHYTAVVDAGLTDLAGNSLDSSYSWSFTTAPGPITDTTAPVATALVPTAGATGIDVATTVIVAFDEAIDPASLTAGSFQLLEGANVVTTTMYHDAVNNLLILSPDASLAHETIYTAQVSAGITDLVGNSLGADFSWTFTTRADNTIPQLLLINPEEDAIDVALDVVLTAQFDELIDPASVAGFSITGVTGTASVDGDGSTVRFVPDQPLANLTTYEATLPGTLMDLAGNQLNYSKTWSFTTLADQIAPQVVQTSPAEGAVAPVTQQVVTIEFDEPLAAATVDSNSVSVEVDGQPFAVNNVSLFPSNRINVTLPALSYDTSIAVHLSPTITDLVGNPLAAAFDLNFSVEPDNYPPSITGRAPGIDGRVVPPSARLQVQFSEPMDRNLISPATVNIQGVSGIVSYDDTADTVSFIPDGDLTPGQQYTAQVSASLTDLAGNPLPGPESWNFTVDGAPLQISDDSSAGHGPARVAFGGTDGFAVWSVTSGTGVKLVAARRNASSTTFAVEQTIAAYPGDTYHLQVAIASNGSTFAAVWVRPQNQRIYASVFSGTDWSTPQVLGSAGGGVGRLGIVSNGSSYAAGWNSRFTYYASIFDGANWNTSTLGATSTGSSGSVGPLELVSDGTGYAMTWVGRVSVYGGTSWSTINMGSFNLEIVAGNTGYAVSWYQYATTYPGRNWIYARVHNGTSWSPSVQLTDYNDIGYDHYIASNGGSYAVVATAALDVTSGDRKLDIFQFNGTGWDRTNLQTVAWNAPLFFDVQIASNGASYAVTWRNNDVLLASVNLGAPQTLFAADVDESYLVAGGSNYFVVEKDTTGRIHSRAFVNAWLSATTLSAADSVAQSLDIVVNGSSVLIGYGTDTADARMAYHSVFVIGSNTFTTTANRFLVKATHLGGVRNPVAAVNGAGASMIVWEQFDAGTWQVRGRSYRNGSPDPVHVISTTGQSPAIAADASTFMITWEDNRQVFARRYTPSTDTLGSATLLGDANPQDKPSIASNGSGFMVGWTVSRDVRAAEFTGAWGTASTLYTDSSDFQQDAVVASAGGEYAIIWMDDGFSTDVLRAQVRSAGNWSSTVLLDSGISLFSQTLLSDGSSYAALYRDGSNVTARVFAGTSWSGATNLGFGSILAATDGSEYRILYGNTQLDERVYSSGVWSDAIDSNLHARALGSDGAGYVLLGEVINGNDRTLYAASRSASGWSESVPIVTITDALFGTVAIDGDAGIYLPLWAQPANTEAIAQRLWLLPDN